METAGKKAIIYEFGCFRLIPDELLLLNNGKPVSLNPKAFAVLSLLVTRHGHLVSKSEIIESIWEDVCIEEGAVAKAVWFIRNSLGDISKETFIQTIPKRGYRFIATVSVLNDPANDVSETKLLSTGYRLPLLPEHEPESDRISQQESPSSSGDINTPTKRSAGDGNGFGPRETVSSVVESRNRSTYYRWAKFGGLAAVLVGGAAIFLAVWSTQRFGSDAAASGRGTTSEQAYEFLILAQNIGARRGKVNTAKALEYVDRALEFDANYARAWAAKAHIHGDLVGHGDPKPRENYQAAMEAIRKAISIDPGLSEAYSALCYQKNRYEYDPVGAEAACQQALQLDQNSATGHKTYANFLYSRGRFDEAIAESKRAIQLEPSSYANQQVYGLALHFARRYGEAETQFRRLLELNPDHSYIHGRLVRIFEAQGRYPEAFEYLITKMTMEKADDRSIKLVESAYATSGWPGVTRERIKLAEAEANTNAFLLACLYSGIGEKDRAFEYLEKAYRERSFLIAVIDVEPQLDPLRSDPRYADLIRRIGSQK